METAEHREPCEPRGSRTDLGAPAGEIPPGNSTAYDLQMLWDEMHQRIEWKSAQRIIEMAPAALLRLPLWIAFLIIGAGVNILGFLGNRILDNPTSRLAPREMPEPTKVTSISAGMKRDVGAVRNDLEKNGYASDPERVVAGEMPDPPKILFPVDVEHAIGIVGRELEKRSRERPACFRKFWQTTYCQVVESPSRIAWSPATIAQTKRRPGLGWDAKSCSNTRNVCLGQAVVDAEAACSR